MKWAAAFQRRPGAAQWEVSNRALEVLKNTRDAKGRHIEVCKIRLPPPQFRNYREAEGLAVSAHLRPPPPPPPPPHPARRARAFCRSCVMGFPESVTCQLSRCPLLLLTTCFLHHRFGTHAMRESSDVLTAVSGIMCNHSVGPG